MENKKHQTSAEREYIADIDFEVFCVSFSLQLMPSNGDRVEAIRKGLEIASLFSKHNDPKTEKTKK